MNTQIRLPHLLLNHIEELVKRHDSQFIRDMSRWLNIPINDIRSRVFGSKQGVLTPVIHEAMPWCAGSQCAMSECVGGALWIRCSAMAVENDACMNHRTARPSASLTRFDAPELGMLERRRPVRYEGLVYWASKDGDMVDSQGNPVKMTIDWETGFLSALTST